MAAMQIYLEFGVRLPNLLLDRNPQYFLSFCSVGLRLQLKKTLMDLNDLN